MYEYGIYIKSVRHLQNIVDVIFTLDVKQFFLLMTKSFWCKWTKRSFGKASKSYSSCGPISFSKSVR